MAQFYLRLSFIKGNDVTFPHRMGTLEARKIKSSISFKDGKLKTNLPVDWDKTLKLWYEDVESFNNKTLINHILLFLCLFFIVYLWYTT